MRDATTEAIVAALSTYGERVASATCDMIDETLSLAGMEGVQAVMPSGIFSRDEVERISRYQVGKVLKGDAEGFAQQVAADTAGLVYQTNIRTALYQAGRGVNGNPVSLRTTGHSATVAYARPNSDYEVRWQRIPQGAETCDFCLMLASRGAVYLSERSAMGNSPDDPDHVHRGCDCIVICCPCHRENGQLVQDVTFEGYDTGDMYDLWKEWSGVTERYASENMRDKGWRDAMREEKLALMEARIGRREW